MSWDGLNRRKFPRIVYPCLVKLAAQAEGTQACLTHTENIGVGGIGLIVRKEIKLFSAVGLEIDLLDDVENIIAEGKVVWVVRRKATEATKPFFYDIGVEFERISAQDKTRLKNTIERFIQKGGKVLKPVY